MATQDSLTNSRCRARVAERLAGPNIVARFAPAAASALPPFFRRPGATKADAAVVERRGVAVVAAHEAGFVEVAPREHPEVREALGEGRCREIGAICAGIGVRVNSSVDPSGLQLRPPPRGARRRGAANRRRASSGIVAGASRAWSTCSRPAIEQHRTMRAARLLVAIGIGRVARWNTVDGVTPLCGGNASSTPPTSGAWSR
jgi:hypothetical protein